MSDRIRHTVRAPRLARRRRQSPALLPLGLVGLAAIGASALSALVAASGGGLLLALVAYSFGGSFFVIATAALAAARAPVAAWIGRSADAMRIDPARRHARMPLAVRIGRPAAAGRGNPASGRRRHG